MTSQSAAPGSNALSVNYFSCSTKVVGRSSFTPLAASRRGLGWLCGVVSVVAAITLLCFLGAQAQAQNLLPSWYQQSPGNTPGNRYIHSMAYDAGHSQVVLFGGFNSGGDANDTWLWDGGNWTQANPASVPPPRSAPAMVYDPVHKKVVLFGGFVGASTRLNDTWLWDGTNWTQASPTNSPSGRSNDDMVFDPATGQIILFGGTNGTSLGDTWLWDGTNWAQASPTSSPSARSEYGMAYDPAISQVVLFGGNPSGAVNDTWLWNGTNWTQVNPATNPTARYAHGMEYDAAIGQVVLFGGDNGSTPLNDTWYFNGTNWTQAAISPATAPTGRYIQNGLVYDSTHQQMVMFGGYSGSSQLGDTWVFGLPGNLGNAYVCPAGATTPSPCSRTIAFTYLFANGATLATTPTVVTQGAAGLDFTLNSAQTTCSGTVAPGTCTVSVTFAPRAPGVRMGAIQLSNSGNTVVATTLISGVGQGPAAAIAPGSPSIVASGLNAPYALATDAAGNLFITDVGTAQVLKVAPGGSTSTVGVSVSRPAGVAVDGAGDLFIADQGQSAIIELPAGCTSSACQFTLAASTGAGQPSAVAVDTAGDVFFTAFSNSASTPPQAIEIPVGCISTACAKVLFTGTATQTPSQPDGIAVDAAGDLFIADGGGPHSVTKIPAGCASTACQTTVGTGFEAPTGVAVDAAGDVFVSDANLGVFEVPAGCASSSCQSVVYAGGAPFGVAIDAMGDVFVPQGTGTQVYEVNRSQSEVLNFPTTTLGTTSTASLTLQNIGNQTLLPESPGLITVSGTSYSNTPGPGTPADCSGTASLTPGAQCNVSILFSPQSYTQPNIGSASFATNTLNAVDNIQGVNLFGMGAKPVQSFYPVTVIEPGSGSGTVTDLSNAISCTETNGTTSGTCASNLPGSGVVTFLATPSGGSTFQGWGGACASSGTNPSCSLVLTAATSITATFVNPVTYPLTVTTSGLGAGTVTDNLGEIACSGANGATLGLCSGPYPSGTAVTLTAKASGTSVFVGWGGACAASGASASCIVTMASALTVSASFVAPPAAQAGTLKPITAGIVYGQGGSFTSNTANNGGVNANSLGNAQGMFVDSTGNLYVADGANNRVLFYPAGSTTPTRVYGQIGSFTSNAANNGGISANSLSNPQGIAVDGSGNVYISDESNSRVLFYPAGSTTATRVYGQPNFATGSANNGGISANSLNQQIGIALDSGGNLYVADYGNSRVLFYPSGSTTATHVYGQGGSLTSNAVNHGGISANSLNQASAVALDSSDDLYVADVYNNRVLFYPANSTSATQVYGQGGTFNTASPNDVGITPTGLNNPLALTVDSNGGLFVVDRSNNRVLYYPFGSTTATRVYGQSGSFSSNAQNNGGVSANSLNQPWGIALDPSGNVYIADYGNNRVLEYGSFGKVNACPAGQTTPAPCSKTVTYSYSPAISTLIGATQVVTQGATGLDFTLGTGNTCAGGIGASTSCNVNVNFTPLAAGLRTGAVELFDNTGIPLASAQIYGVGQGPVIAYGPGAQGVLLNNLTTTAAGVAVDAAGNVYVAGGLGAAKLTTSGVLTTYPVTGGFYDVAVDGAGNVYLADSSNNRIVEIAPSGVQTILPVTGLSFPSGVKVDGSGNVFITDRDNNRVVKRSPSGVQTTVPTTGLVRPYYPAVDAAGDVFFLDDGRELVLKVTPAGIQSTIPFIGLGAINGVAVDAAGDVFASDQGSNKVFEITPGGVQTTVASSGLIVPAGLAVDAAGNLFIAVNGLSQVVVVIRSQVPSLSFATTNVGSTSLDSPQTISLQNIGNQPLTGSLALNLGSNFTQTASLDCSTGFPLAPGASCIDTFGFTPQSATFLSGTAVYTDNNLNGSPAIQTITFGGTGATNGVAGLATVPNVVGQTQAAATSPLAVAGLATGTVSTASSQTVPAGTIISQNPVAGTQVAVASAVNLLVSSGIAQPNAPNPLSLENNYFVTGDYVSAGVTLRGLGVGGIAMRSITIPSYAQDATNGVPDGSDVVDAFLYWETLENTPFASSTTGTFNGYPIVGQQIGNDLPNYVDGQFTGTIRAYRAAVNAYLPVGANGIRIVSGSYTVSLPDGGTALPLTEGASLVMVYRVLSPNFPLKSVVIYDGSAASTVAATQVVQGFYDAVGGASGTGKSTNLFASGGAWNSTANTVTLGKSDQYSAPLTPAAAYAAVILSTPVNNSNNDGILDAWKAGPASGDFHAGQPGYYDAKTGTWVGLPGAKHGQKDLFVQLDYMCGALLSNGSCDPTKENLFPSPDVNGNDPLAMVQQAFSNSGVQLHLQVGNAVPEDTCVDGTGSQLCQFPGATGVVGWKNSLEFSKLYPRNLAACLTGGDCTTRFPYGQKDSYHYVLMGHSLAIPAWNTRYGTLTSINVINGVTTIGTVDRGTGINKCPSRITLAGVLGNPGLNGVYNTTGCVDSKTITLATPGVPNWSYPNSMLPEPVIGLTSGTISSISGYSDLGGADSAVTLGLWLTAPNQDMSKKANVLAGTIFHEIGHTLGLSHGGLYYDTSGSYVPTFDANCKPNYQSVMNYLFQLDGVGPNQTVAFSNQTLATLNENSAGSVTQLTDGLGNAATFPTSAWYVPYTTGSPVSPATLHCDGTPLNGESGYRIDASIAPITPAWSNGQDLSFIGALQSAERGFNDLTNLDLRQVGATGGEFASLASVLSFGSSVAPLNIGANGNVTLGSGGTVALGSGGTVTLGSGGNVTLGSGGTITLGSGGNVTLGSGGNVTLGSGGTVTPGSGGTVTLGSGGNVTLGSGGTITLGSGGTITLGSGGNVTLGSGGVIALGSGGTIAVPSTGGTYSIDGSGGIITLGSGGNVTLGSGGNVTLGSGGVIALGSGGNVTLGSGGNVTLGSGGTVTLGSGGVIALGSGGNVTLGSGGTIALGSGGTVTLGSGGNVTLGSGGTVTLGSGGNVALGSGGNVTLGSGGAATLGAGGTVTLGSGGTVTLGSGGNVTLGSGGVIALGSGGTVALGSGGNVTLGSGGVIALGSGGTVTLGSGGTVTLGSGGTVTLGSGGLPTAYGAGSVVTLTAGGTVTLGSGGNVTLGSGGNVTLGSGGIITLGSGGNVTLGSGGNVTLGSGGTITLGSGGTVTLGSGGNVTLGSGGVVTLGSGGTVIEGIGSTIGLGSVNNITPASGGPQAANELTYETANSVVRPPSLPTETQSPKGVAPATVRINWNAPTFGVVQTYTIYRSSNGATPIVIGSVSGVNGNPPATEFTDTNPDLTSATVVYTVTTTLVPDPSGPSRQSVFSPPAVIKNDQSITLGPLPSSVTIANPPTVTATAMSGGTPNGLQVIFSATGSCAIGSQSIVSNVSSARVTLNGTGSCTVIASQPGSTTFNAANSVSGTFLVLPQGSTTTSQTINFPPLQNAQYGGSFSLSATATVSGTSTLSGLPVTFTASGPCTNAGVIKGVGVCSITASVAGNSTYSAASLTQSFIIYPAVLKVTATDLSMFVGQAVPPLAYTVTGFVNNDLPSVVIGMPALSTTATSASSPGSYPITVSTGTLATANYSFLYVNGSLTVQTKNQSPLTLITTSPLTYGQSETLSATGGSTGGVVTYNLVGGTCSISGARLTANSGTGACLVTATMAGNSGYNAVTSTPANSVTLNPASQTITYTTNPPASAAYTSTFKVAAAGGGSSNPVVFTSAGACTNSSATYTMTNSTGTCSVIANQAGNTNYAAAPQVTKIVNAVGPLLSVSSSSINFGTVYFGSISAQTITVTNTGTSAATITDPILSIVKGGNSNEFIALSLCPTTLAAGKNCTVLIGFIAGPYYTPQTATLQIMSSAPGSPQPVALTATVINPQASLNPTSLSFGTIKHATSTTLKVTLSNPGGTALSLTGISITGANATNFAQTNTCGSSLAAGASCSLAIKFTPPTTGTFSANLTVVDNAQSGTQTVALSGKGN